MKTLTQWWLGLALLLAVGTLTHAQDTTTEPAKEPAKATATPDHQYLIYYMGNRIGWGKSTISMVEVDGKSLRLESQESYVEIIRSLDRQKFITKGTTETWTDPKTFVEVKNRDLTVQGGQTTEKTITRNGKNFSLNLKDNTGPERNYEVVAETDNVKTDYQAFMELKTKGELEKGKTVKYKKFDADTRTFNDATMTINGQGKQKLVSGKIVEGWMLQVLNKGRLESAIVDADDGHMLYLKMPSGISLELVDEIPDPFKAEKIEIQNIMQANVAATPDKDLDVMDISFKYKHDDGEGIPMIADENKYHNVKKTEDGYALRLKSHWLPSDYKPVAFPLAEVKDDVKRFGEPTPLSQSDDEVLAAKAKELTKGSKTTLDAAQKICHFVSEHLVDASGDTGSASAKQAYEECKGDCTEHSALFVALARAAGLPARNCSGMLYAVFGKVGIFGYHAWSEVWLGDRWVVVDATVDRVGVASRYLFFRYDEPGEIAGNGRLERCLAQKVHPVVDRYRMKDNDDWNWQRKGAVNSFDEDK